MVEEKLLELQLSLMSLDEVSSVFCCYWMDNTRMGIPSIEDLPLSLTPPLSFYLQPSNEQDLNECCAWFHPAHFNAVVEELASMVSDSWGVGYGRSSSLIITSAFFPLSIRVHVDIPYVRSSWLPRELVEKVNYGLMQKKRRLLN